MVLLIRSFNKELLQQSTQLNTLKTITDYCESYETSQQDLRQLKGDGPSIASNNILNDISQEELVAAVSAYRKNKRGEKRPPQTTHEEQKKCFNCGGDWPNASGCPAKHHRCVKCKKKGHFEAVCKTSGNTLTTSAIIISGIKTICGCLLYTSDAADE